MAGEQIFKIFTGMSPSTPEFVFGIENISIVGIPPIICQLIIIIIYSYNIIIIIIPVPVK